MKKKNILLKYVLPVIVLVCGTVLASIVLDMGGITTERIKYTIMGDNYEGAYVIDNIDYVAKINVFDISYRNMASGVVVEVQTTTLESLPAELRYPIKHYFKSNFTSESELKNK